MFYTVSLITRNRLQKIEAFAHFDDAVKYLKKEIDRIKALPTFNSEWYENENDLNELEENRSCELTYYFSHHNDAILSLDSVEVR